MEKRSVLIVDSDKDWIVELYDLLLKNDQFEMLKPVCDGDTALRIILESKPDVIIMDLLIPYVDGLYIASYIANRISEYTPFIYMLSSIGYDRTRFVLHDELVSYISLKPINAFVVADNIARMNKISEPHQLPSPHDMALQDDHVYNVDHFIHDALNELGLPLHLFSSQCTFEVIKYILQNNTYYKSITQVYESVSSKIGDNLKCTAIERNVRTAILRVKKQNTALYRELLSNSRNRITNKEFINKVVSYIQMKQN